MLLNRYYTTIKLLVKSYGSAAMSPPAIGKKRLKIPKR